MGKEYLDRNANSSTTKLLFGRGLLVKGDKHCLNCGREHFSDQCPNGGSEKFVVIGEI